MEIELHPKKGPIFEQIVAGMIRMLIRGDISPGDRLPSTRELAVQIRVNPNTVVHAFKELEARGISESRRGTGAFVREDVDVAALRDTQASRLVGEYLGEMRALGFTAEQAAKRLGREMQ